MAYWVCRLLCCGGAAVSYQEYTDAVRQAQAENPTWRPGQTFFNVLWHMHQDLAEQVSGTNIDPFYSDHREFDEKQLIQCRFITFVKFMLDGEWVDLVD